MPLSLSQTTRRLLLAVGTAAGTLALSAPAMAGGVSVSFGSTLFAGQTPVNECAAAPMTQPFLTLGDPRTYVLAPNGHFSDTSGGGWQFASGAQVTGAGGVDGASGVLTLPPGGTALSPLMCVDLDYPTARLWSSGGGSVNIKVVYPDTAKAKLDPKSVADIKGSTLPTWRLSSDFNMQPQLGGKLAGWRRVAFVLTNTSKAPVQVDDLFVDPRMR
jgi:hypothetical protein